MNSVEKYGNIYSKTVTDHLVIIFVGVNNTIIQIYIHVTSQSHFKQLEYHL